MLQIRIFDPFYAAITERAKERSKYSRIKSVFGITKSQYHRIINFQGGLCAICASVLATKRKTHLDHCHLTGKIRGILCGDCNSGLGFFRDNPIVLELAAEYIRINS